MIYSDHFGIDIPISKYIFLIMIYSDHSIDLSTLRNVPIGICMFLRIGSLVDWSNLDNYGIYIICIYFLSIIEIGIVLSIPNLKKCKTLYVSKD